MSNNKKHPHHLKTSAIRPLSLLQKHTYIPHNIMIECCLEYWVHGVYTAAIVTNLLLFIMMASKNMILQKPTIILWKLSYTAT